MFKMRYLMVALAFLLLSDVLSTRAQEDLEDFQKKLDKKFEQFREEVDKEFLDFLNRKWREMKSFEGFVADEKPKPITIPFARPPEIPEEKPPVEVKPIKKKEEKIPPTPKPKVEPKKIPKEKEYLSLPLVFYNTPLSIPYTEELKVIARGKLDQSKISAFWETACKSDYRPCLGEVLEIKNRLRLNDWEYCLLLDNLSRDIYGHSASERNLFVWFMLLKSGFNARLGIFDGRVFLLLPCKTTLYNVPYYVTDGEKYYIVSFSDTSQRIKSLYTYQGNYPASNKLVDLQVYNAPNIEISTYSKGYKFLYSGKEYSLSTELNKNVIDLYENYPHTDFDVYFNAPVSPQTGNPILAGLRSIIQNKSDADVINILLRFVQTAFEYKTDNGQFGREKVLFPEETLFYPYSDCEDRSALFAYLVKNLTDHDIIGLDYPGHVATAVKFTGDAEGDYVYYKNTKYLICDPTFINANYGECMPKYKKLTPQIIPIRD